MKNLIGNTLTILILLMSCFFFAAALMVGAAQRNWKAEVAELTTRAEAAERQVNDAKTGAKNQLITIEREKVARAQQIATLFSQKRQLEDQLAERNKVLNSEIEMSQSRMIELREAQARVKQQDTELEAIQVINTELKNDIAEKYRKVQNLMQETFEQQTKIELLTDTVEKWTAEVAVRKKIMDGAGLDVFHQVSHIVPKLTSTIAEIGQGGITFAILVGSDDGIRVDHEFDIYRGKRFIARAIVTKVREDIAVLKLVEGLTQSPIREGDYVTSEL